MADEIRKVIEVDVTGAVSSLEEMEEEVTKTGYSFKSLGDAKKYIDKLRASLIDLDETSDEYADTVAEIDDVQEKLNKALKVTGSTLKNAEGSYNALSKQMSELKKRFKETNDEAERKSLAKQITSINDKLKDMDASIGNYQRNVGNYEGAFTKGLTGIADKVKALGNPLAMAKKAVSALGGAMKALIANPVGAVIMAIVAAVTALKKGFEKSEEASNSLKRAFSALQPVMNAVSNVLTGFAKIVGSVAEKAIPALVNGLQKASEWMMKLLNKLGIISDEKLKSFQDSIERQKEMVKVTQDLTDREIKLTQTRRNLQVESAKKELEISELRAKAADKEKYTAAERQKFLEQAVSTEKSLNKMKLDAAQEEYDILLERSKLTDNDVAMNDALAAAEANLYNTKKEYYDKERKLISQVSAARSEGAKTNSDLIKKELEELNKINERVELELMDSTDKELEIARRKYESEKALLEKYGQDTEKLTEEYSKKVQEIKQGDLDTIEEINQRMMKAGDRDLEVLKKKYESEKALMIKYGQDTVKLTEEYNQNVAALKAKDSENNLKDIENECELRKLMVENETGLEREKNVRLAELEEERLQDQMKVYQELLNIDNLSLEQKDEYVRQIELLEQRIQLANTKTLEVEKKNKEEEKKDLEERIQQYSELASTLGDMLGDIGDYWMDSVQKRVEAGEISEEEGQKEFENAKALSIASAIITGLAGVATAIATAQKLGPPMGPIVGAINAAAVATSTAIQVAKIKSTTLKSGSSSGNIDAGSVTPTQEATAYTPQYSTTITGESETVDLANAVSSRQKDQRVYVVESDINEAGRRVQVRESESTF